MKSRKRCQGVWFLVQLAARFLSRGVYFTIVLDGSVVGVVLTTAAVFLEVSWFYNII
jgi:hypothetical protein